MYNIKKEIQLAIFIVVTIFLAVFIVSCGSSKKTQSSDTTETKTIFKTDTFTKVKTDTVRVTKTETKTVTNTEVKFDTIQKDCPKNKIVYKNNGDVEIEGNIKEYNHQISNWKNRYDSLATAFEEEVSKRLYYEDEAKKVKTVTVTKKSSFFDNVKTFIFWLFIIMLIISIILRRIKNPPSWLDFMTKK